MLHDKLFLKDLKNLGMEVEAVRGTEPLLATKGVTPGNAPAARAGRGIPPLPPPWRVS